MTNLSAAVESPARFVYTNINGRRSTIAYTYDDAAQCIRFGVAQCSHKDQFVKKIGRDIAFGRLVKGGGVEVPYSSLPSTSYSDIARYFSTSVG